MVDNAAQRHLNCAGMVSIRRVLGDVGHDFLIVQ